MTCSSSSSSDTGPCSWKEEERGREARGCLERMRGEKWWGLEGGREDKER